MVRKIDREERPFAPGHRHRNWIPRPDPRRLHGGPRPRSAGHRRRPRQDHQGREGRGTVLRTRPGAAAAGRTWTPGGSVSPCPSPRWRSSGRSTSCASARQRASPAMPTSSFVDAAADALAPHLTAECLIVGKSTVPVGTARRVMSRVRATAPAGRRVELASNPEFLREGFAVQDSLAPDRIVVGVTSLARRGPAAGGLRRAAGGRGPAARHGPGDGRTGQGGGERVPGDQDLVHQRHGRDLRGGGRRRDAARGGARVRRQDRPAVPVAWARVRRRVPAQGHPGVPGDGR